MKKYICDKCGTTLTINSINEFANKFRVLNDYLTALTGYRDLCNNCNNLLEHLLTKNREKAKIEEEQKIKEFVNQA